MKITVKWKSEVERRRRKRRALDLTLIYVAAKIGVSESTLHRYERGSSRPTPEADAAWALALERASKAS